MMKVHTVTRGEVERAWQAYRLIQIAIAGQIERQANEYLTALADTAYARFLMLFEQWGGR